jgi:nucleoside 2-deoxyribosyltransferase
VIASLFTQIGGTHPVSDSPHYKVYLSATISNAANNQYLADFFSEEEFEFFLPQNITPAELSHTHFPTVVYKGCVDEMERSDMGLLLFDSYGRDCAWESGWYAARPDKVLIAFVESSSHFTRDWMIKGGIDGLVTTNPRLFEVARKDPILESKHLIFVESSAELPRAMKEIYRAVRSEAPRASV